MKKTSIPWINRNDTIIVATIFGVSLALFSTQWFTTLRIHPSAIGAERILAGQIPYRDFWTLYAPGSFYLLAFFFRIFGTHLVVEYAAASTFCAAALCMYFRLITYLVNKTVTALVCTAIVLAAIFSTHYYLKLGPYPPTLFLVMSGMYLSICYFREDSRFKLACAGIVIGLAILIKHDVAVYSAVAISSGLVVHNVINSLSLFQAIRSTVVDLAIFLATAAIIAIPVLSYFAYLAGTDMWQDLIVFPGTVFRFARPEHYPMLIPIGIYDEWRLKMLFNLFRYVQFNLPLIIFLFGIFSMGLAFGKQRSEYVAPGTIFIVAFLFHYSSAHVQINTNIISLSLYAAALGGLSYRLLDQYEFAGQYRSFASFGGLIATLWIVAILTQQLYEQQIAKTEPLTRSNLPKISGIMIPSEKYDHMVELKNLIDEIAPDNQPVFLGLHRHDVTVIGDSETYFILDRINPTRHDQLHPGIVDRADFQRQIIHDLENLNVNTVLLAHIFSDETLDRVKAARRANLPETGGLLLDKYIDNHFTNVQTIGRHDVLRRRPVRP